MNKINGWLNIYKPRGISSFFVLKKIKKKFKFSKIGHAGTLDPLAEGILPIAIGKTTKLISFINKHSKEYEFEIKWGEQTSTDDSEGEIIKRSKKIPEDKEIKQILKKTIGIFLQTPPKASAVKIDDGLEVVGVANVTGDIVHTSGITQLSVETVSGDSAGTDAIAVTTDITFLDMSSGGMTLSIADGVDGQIKYIICNQIGTVAGGGGPTPAILDNTNGNWTTQIRWDAVGEAATLIFDSQTGKWNIVGSQGVTIT